MDFGADVLGHTGINPNYLSNLLIHLVPLARLIILLFSEILKHLFDVLEYNLVQIVPNPIDFVEPLTCRATMRFTLVVFSEISPQLSDGLSWIWNTRVYVPLTMTCNHFGDFYSHTIIWSDFLISPNH